MDVHAYGDYSSTSEDCVLLTRRELWALWWEGRDFGHAEAARGVDIREELPVGSGSLSAEEYYLSSTSDVSVAPAPRLLAALKLAGDAAPGEAATAPESPPEPLSFRGPPRLNSAAAPFLPGSASHPVMQHQQQEQQEQQVAAEVISTVVGAQGLAPKSPGVGSGAASRTKKLEQERGDTKGCEVTEAKELEQERRDNRRRATMERLLDTAEKKCVEYGKGVTKFANDLSEVVQGTTIHVGILSSAAQRPDQWENLWLEPRKMKSQICLTISCLTISKWGEAMVVCRFSPGVCTFTSSLVSQLSARQAPMKRQLWW